MRMVWTTPLALALGAGAAMAEEGPSFDCARAESDAERLVCADADLAALDRRVSARFGAAVAAAEGLDAGAEAAAAELRATQRGWIGGRDECWKAEDLRACVADAYLRREAELVAGWMLEPPTATLLWVCDGNPANEIAIMTFDTELPAVRMEYGDTVATGVRVPSGSGVRYEADFGRGFWEKGDEAILTWPEGTDMTCERAG